MHDAVPALTSGAAEHREEGRAEGTEVCVGVQVVAACHLAKELHTEDGVEELYDEEDTGEVGHSGEGEEQRGEQRLQALGGLDEAQHARNARDAEDPQQIGGEDRAEVGIETDGLEQVGQCEENHSKVELVPSAHEVLGAAVTDELESRLGDEGRRGVVGREWWGVGGEWVVGG